MMDPADTEAPPVANFSINRLGHLVIYTITWVHACSRWTDVYSNDSMELEMKVREKRFIFKKFLSFMFCIYIPKTF